MFGIFEVSAVLAGFALLIWGSDKFVDGAAGMARTLNVSPLIIGLVIVGFGTSAPEMLVAAVAGLDGNTGLAIGNALGSNITNIALVLGATALMVPLTVHSKLLKREFPVLFLIMGLTLILLLDGNLGRIDGIILLSGLLGFILWMIYLGKKSQAENSGVAHDPMQDEFEEEMPDKLPIGKALVLLTIGLIVLLVGAKLVVWGAVSIAQAFGISDLIIGLTVVAIGTSLPELATTITSAKKGEHDIAIGNIIGSNMFNLLGVLGIPAVIHPAAFDSDVMTRDVPVMVLLTIALYLMAKGWAGKAGKINRIEGAGLLIAYFAYLGTLFVMST
ncbi:MAG: calcium/sodium antiporter [Gammaproteobacteria bacterium]|nr:calcium/sodium antiporter [Gammaproteobacteria bacterium]